MARLSSITFACADPPALSAFWADVLGYVREEPAPGWAEAIVAEGGDPERSVGIVDPAGDGPRLFFNKREKSPTVELPIHLDLNAADPKNEVERLLRSGAKLVAMKSIAVGSFSETWTVMRDPEGNGFCVQGPDPRGAERPFVFNVTFACADPSGLAAFWAEALGYVRHETDPEFLRQLLNAGLDPAELEAYVAVVHPERQPPRLLFQRRQKTPTTEIPIHLDLVADDREAEVARLASLGAAEVESKRETTGPSTEVWTVMRDPDGNGFCVAGAPGSA